MRYLRIWSLDFDLVRRITAELKKEGRLEAV